VTLLRAVREHATDAVVSAVIPVLDGGARLHTLLDALHTQDVGAVDVVLVDSQSSDGAVEAAARRWPTLRVFEVAREAFDHGRVRSEGVLLARCPLVALFSQDAVPLGAGCLRAMMAGFDDPQVAGVMARQVARPGADPGVVATLDRWTPAGRGVSVRGGEGMAAARFDNVGSMVRRSAVEEIPFPPRAFGEDLAWGAAVLRAGWTLGYAAEAIVEHHHDAGLVDTYRRHRVSHQQAREEFGVRAVPSLLALPGAFLGGLPGDVADGGVGWAVRGAPRRIAALLGQWSGGRS
jgi:GT2 family glycosyltransferase